jgi:hypothetical protein
MSTEFNRYVIDFEAVPEYTAIYAERTKGEEDAAREAYMALDRVIEDKEYLVMLWEVIVDQDNFDLLREDVALGLVYNMVGWCGRSMKNATADVIRHIDVVLRVVEQALRQSRADWKDEKPWSRFTREEMAGFCDELEIPNTLEEDESDDDDVLEPVPGVSFPIRAPRRLRGPSRVDAEIIAEGYRFRNVTIPRKHRRPAFYRPY